MLASAIGGGGVAAKTYYDDLREMQHDMQLAIQRIEDKLDESYRWRAAHEVGMHHSSHQALTTETMARKESDSVHALRLGVAELRIEVLEQTVKKR